MPADRGVVSWVMASKTHRLQQDRADLGRTLPLPACSCCLRSARIDACADV